MYITSMWIAGVMQGLMWRAFNADGTLTYSFIESLVATKPYYVVRLLGGLLFLTGMFFFAWNTWKTLKSKEMKPIPASAPAMWGDHA
jgi:cytochrome c oxidase cbb3-type subunit 1